jgi:3-phenylpropionate/cinnamic acid dioxygenase small subunit
MTEAELRVLLEREAIRDLVQQTAVLLDKEELSQWLGLFAADSGYEIVAFGNEISQSMTWWKSNAEELRKLLEDVPRQVRDTARRLHIVIPTKVDVSEDRALVHSNFTVLRTTQDGKTNVYVAGTYVDNVVKRAGRWLYEKHQVVLHTRMLDAFTHIPL